jgi:hypothetical protein
MKGVSVYLWFDPRDLGLPLLLLRRFSVVFVPRNPPTSRNLVRIGGVKAVVSELSAFTTGAKAGAGDGVDQNEFMICRPSPSIWRTSVCTWWCIAHFIA